MKGVRACYWLVRSNLSLDFSLCVTLDDRELAMQQEFAKVFQFVALPILNATFQILHDFDVFGFSDGFVDLTGDPFDGLQSLWQLLLLGFNRRSLLDQVLMKEGDG